MTALPGAGRLPDHVCLPRGDIGALRGTEIENDGTVCSRRPLRKVLVHEAAHILSQRNAQRCCACTNLRMPLRVERYLGTYHHYGAIITLSGPCDKACSGLRRAAGRTAALGDWLCAAGGFGVQSAPTMEEGSSDV